MYLYFLHERSAQLMKVYNYINSINKHKKGGSLAIALNLSKMLSKNTKVSSYVLKNIDGLKLKITQRNEQSIINHSPFDTSIKNFFYFNFFFKDNFSVIHSQPNFLLLYANIDSENNSFWQKIFKNIKLQLKNFLIYSMIILFSKKVILIDESHLKYFPRIIQSKLIVIPNIIFAEPKIKKVKDENVTQFLYLGRLESIKRIDKILEIWKVLSTDENYFLDIVGDGAELENIKDMVKKNDLHNVRLRPYISNINDTLDNSKILLMASLFEGTPVVIQEGQARGVIPIVLNTFSAAKNMIHHGVDGFIIEDKEPEVIAKEITTILKSSNLINISRNCTERITNHNNEPIIDKWVKIISG